MDGFTVVDAVVAVVILISALLAYSRGFVRETLSIVGWVVAAIVARIFAPQFEPLVREIPVIGEFLSSCELSIIVAFFVVFAIALIVVSIFTPIFSSMVQKSALGGVDQGVGFLFGVFRGILLVAVALVVYDSVIVGGFPMVDNSRSVLVFGRMQTAIKDQIPTETPEWITDQYEELTAVCINGQSDTAALFRTLPQL